MLRPSHEMSHSHPIICCFRILKKIKMAISHLLFNTPSLSVHSGPSLPLCPFTLSLLLSPPSIHPLLLFSLSLRPMLCLMNRPSTSVSLSHPSGCPPSVSQTPAHARSAHEYCCPSIHSHIHKHLNTQKHEHTQKTAH